MSDIWPALALTGALIFLAASVFTLLATLRAAQFRAEEAQFPIPSPANALTPENRHAVG